MSSDSRHSPSESLASRITNHRLAQSFRGSRPAFIPYIMAGDPDLETTALLLRTLTRVGASAIELGVPYGDPLADGPTIAAAAMRALEGGTRLADVLQLVRAEAHGSAPIVLFTYYNPVYQRGSARFAHDSAEAGAAGAIVPDLALEEGEELRNALAERGLAMPLLVAPSTPEERAIRIAAASTGFVYVVSRLGVTGASEAPSLEPLRRQIAALRRATETPLAVGFGISAPEHVSAVNGLVDGVVVGSALIDAYAGTRGEEAAGRVERFCQVLLR
jgi:tryptophan synthase alpha chain